VKHTQKSGMGTDIVMHDRDAKFTASFDAALKEAGLRVQKAAPRAPNTVAFVERFIQTVRQELLDDFIVFGERHLNCLCTVFLDFYHRRRPHQAKENDLLVVRRRRKTKPRTEVIPLSEVRCQQQLGGLLKHYYREAA
jgi:putative transposase